jgi:hypothetical protein
MRNFIADRGKIHDICEEERPAVQEVVPSTQEIVSDRMELHITLHFFTVSQKLRPTKYTVLTKKPLTVYNQSP